MYVIYIIYILYVIYITYVIYIYIYIICYIYICIKFFLGIRKWHITEIVTLVNYEFNMSMHILYKFKHF